MRSGWMLAFVLIAILAGGIISQLPSAMGDSEDPFSSLWTAIFDLQSRDDHLQAQIDELRAERDALLAQTGNNPTYVSDPYTSIKVEAAKDGHMLVHITAGNGGPDRAAGVKITTFYLMPLFEINSIEGDMCEDKSRGIIECIIGTLEKDHETVITIDATARESGEENTWTVDISSTTEDSDYSNNHMTYDFETGSGEHIAVEVDQPAEEHEAAEPEKDDGDPSSSKGTEEPQEGAANQTSTESEAPSANLTSSEIVTENSGNGTSAETENTESEQVEETAEEQAAAEEPTDKSAQEPAEEQGQEDAPEESGESGEESGQDSISEEESTSENSGSEQEESSESGESGTSGESTPQ